MGDGIVSNCIRKLCQIQMERKHCLKYDANILVLFVMTELLSAQLALKRMATAHIQHCGNFCLCHICQSQFGRAKRTQKDTAVSCVAVITLN